MHFIKILALDAPLYPFVSAAAELGRPESCCHWLAPPEVSLSYYSIIKLDAQIYIEITTKNDTLENI